MENRLFSSACDEGILSGDVIEFSGDEGTGKSEMLLDVAAHTLENHKCVFYVDTDARFSLPRFVTILRSRIEPGNDGERTLKELLSRFYYLRCHSTSQLISSLQNMKSLLTSVQDAACLMLDSVSAFYWQDRCQGDDEANQREISKTIHDLLTSYNLVLVATKGTFIGKGPRQDYDFISKQWQKLVKYRFIFHRTASGHEASIGDRRIRFSIGNEGLKFNKP